MFKCTNMFNMKVNFLTQLKDIVMLVSKRYCYNTTCKNLRRIETMYSASIQRVEFLVKRKVSSYS